MKMTRTMFVLLLAFFLASCEQTEEPIEEVTLELIGEETVEIEEGSEYIDMGVLMNGEEADLGYYSNVNIDRVGTYYVKYEYGDVEVLRTVIVIGGAKTELLDIISNFETSTNFSYTLDLDTRFSRGGQEFHTYIYEDYDVNGDYSFGTVTRTSYSMNEYTQNAYIYVDVANRNEEHYMFDEYSYWYQDQIHIQHPTSNVTDFSLDGIRSVTTEDVDGKTVYTGFLNYEDYMVAFNSKINMIPDEYFDFDTDDYVTVTITVEDNHIVEIDVDLLDVMINTLSDASSAVITEYHYNYTFDEYNLIEEIVIPEEGIQAKRLVHPDYTGSGTLTDPYIIMDATQFILIHDNLDKHFELGADIDLSGYSWTPFGYFNKLTGQSYAFTGSLDGKGYSINNMQYIGERSSEEYGLFLKIDGGTVKNITFNNVDISLHETNISFTAGIVAAEILSGEITNVSINGTLRIRIIISDGFSLVSLGSLTGKLSDGVTLGGNSYDVDVTLITNLLDTNYSVHEVAGVGSEYLSTYTSTSTVTIEGIE